MSHPRYLLLQPFRAQRAVAGGAGGTGKGRDASLHASVLLLFSSDELVLFCFLAGTSYTLFMNAPLSPLIPGEGGIGSGGVWMAACSNSERKEKEKYYVLWRDGGQSVSFFLSFSLSFPLSFFLFFLSSPSHISTDPPTLFSLGHFSYLLGNKTVLVKQWPCMYLLLSVFPSVVNTPMELGFVR